MIEIAFIVSTLMNVFLLLFVAYTQHQHTQDRRLLLKSVLAKDATDLAVSEKIAEEKPSTKKGEELVPLSELSDEDWDKVVLHGKQKI